MVMGLQGLTICLLQAGDPGKVLRNRGQEMF